MDTTETNLPRFSPPGLIAWLSLFLLTFAMGGMVNEHWQKLALQAGAFGIISAVGLGSLEKARQLRVRSLQNRTLRERLDRQISINEWDPAHGSQLVTTGDRQDREPSVI